MDWVGKTGVGGGHLIGSFARLMPDSPPACISPRAHRYGLLQAVRQEAKARGAKQLYAHAPVAAAVVGCASPHLPNGQQQPQGGGNGSKQGQNPALDFLWKKGGFREEGKGEESTYTDQRGRPCRRLVAAL